MKSLNYILPILLVVGCNSSAEEAKSYLGMQEQNHRPGITVQQQIKSPVSVAASDRILLDAVFPQHFKLILILKKDISFVCKRCPGFIFSNRYIWQQHHWQKIK